MRRGGYRSRHATAGAVTAIKSSQSIVAMFQAGRDHLHGGTDPVLDGLHAILLGLTPVILLLGYKRSQEVRMQNSPPSPR